MGQSTATLIRPDASRHLLEPVPGQHGLTSRPAPRFLLQHPVSIGEVVPGPADAIPLSQSQPVPLVNVVIKLLDSAAAAVASDPAAAKDRIARASALLQADHERAERDRRDATRTFARGGLAPWQVRQVTKHIDEALASTISTRECATVARLSTGHFRRAFKISFGVTLHRYICRRRVERAQEMMVTTDQPLCQIARRCGFADQSHFTRVFRRLIGPSPATWRRA